MARYNQKKVTKPVPTVSTHEGGVGYSLTPKHELISILATGLNNTFYEATGEREQRLIQALEKVAKTDIPFAAKALVYARSVMGQRTVTHFGAAILAKFLSGSDLGVKFFSKRSKKGNTGGIVFRLDDMFEIAAAYKALNPGKPLSNAIKKGFKLALEMADEYELAKYQGKTRDISLVDIVNLVHPKPANEKMEAVFQKLMKGELKQFNTVEDKNTKAGQVVADKVKAGEITEDEAEKELAALKEDNYLELITNRTIGYLALLRNLRNLLNVTSSDNIQLVELACTMLTMPERVKQSLVFPHQIDLALEVLLSERSSIKCDTKAFNMVVKALNKAYDLAIPNLTELFTSGKTAVVYDSSGSMSSSISIGKNKQGSEGAIKKAALIAATLSKGIGADVFHFANSCVPVSYNVEDTVNTLKTKFANEQGKVGFGTEFKSIFRTLGKNYDRVFIISDMQGADEIKRSADYGNAHIYSIDITGYGNTMFKPDSKVYQIFGYSADIYELIKKVEIDVNAVVKAIDEIVI